MSHIAMFTIHDCTSSIKQNLFCRNIYYSTSRNIHIHFLFKSIISTQSAVYTFILHWNNKQILDGSESNIHNLLDDNGMKKSDIGLGEAEPNITFPSHITFLSHIKCLLY